MQTLTIVSRPNCPNCDTAKSVCSMYSLEYKEQILGQDITVERLAELAPGARELPQIFAGETRIGGLNEFKQYIANQA
ncbi:MAG: glutaredoxin domain-containing protein [Aeromonas popoffii]|uniref:glutaredoxin domain-containing protein n=1 Tax=Aeromonas popoffii TaxID=70856 RepID=UPI003F3D7D2D